MHMQGGSKHNNTKIWQIYMFFGIQASIQRVHTNAQRVHHIHAHIQSVLPSLQHVHAKQDISIQKFKRNKV